MLPRKEKQMIKQKPKIKEVLTRKVDSQGFSIRLREVTDKFDSPAAAVKFVTDGSTIPETTFRSHVSGRRIPRTAAITRYATIYAQLFGTTPEFLLYGDAPLNQLTREVHPQASQQLEFRSIVALPATEEENAGGNSIMQNILRFPRELEAGPNARLWKIPDGDVSMVGESYAFAPGTSLIIEPDQKIQPGHIVLCRPRIYDQWIVRRFKAQAPLAAVQSYKLVAANAFYDPIEINAPEECEIWGRVVYSIHRW